MELSYSSNFRHRSNPLIGLPVQHDAVAPARCSLPIVGVGVSAGEPEVLAHFMSHVPMGSGLAFVVVQHPDATHQGIPAEILQRATSMKVMRVRDRTKVRADRVYITPLSKDVEILQGFLHLLEPTAVHGTHLPIDVFLRSLAHEQRERSVGVLLSSTGSDGALGLLAIKEQAGMVLAKDLSRFGFHVVPRGAAHNGGADVVARVEELPVRILSFLLSAAAGCEENSAWLRSTV